MLLFRGGGGGVSKSIQCPGKTYGKMCLTNNKNKNKLFY